MQTEPHQQSPSLPSVDTQRYRDNAALLSNKRQLIEDKNFDDAVAKQLAIEANHAEQERLRRIEDFQIRQTNAAADHKSQEERTEKIGTAIKWFLGGSVAVVVGYCAYRFWRNAK